MSEVKRKLNFHVVEDDTDTVEVGALFKTEQKRKQKEKAGKWEWRGKWEGLYVKKDQLLLNKKIKK